MGRKIIVIDTRTVPRKYEDILKEVSVHEEWTRPFATLVEQCYKNIVICNGSSYGSVPVDFLCPKFRVAHTKDDGILMHKYTYTNMYIIKKIISCRFILC